MIIETNTTIPIYGKEIPLEVEVNCWDELWDKDDIGKHIRKIIFLEKCNERDDIADNLTKVLVEVKLESNGKIKSIRIPCMGHTFWTA